jgi:hypothetical protein
MVGALHDDFKISNPLIFKKGKGHRFEVVPSSMEETTLSITIFEVSAVNCKFSILSYTVV